VAWTGQTLSKGRYAVLAVLGEGGMGHVYRARDRQQGTEVVIKVPRRGVADENDFKLRFAREVRSLMRLEHPNVVSILDVGEHESWPFAVMPFLAGGSLRHRLEAAPSKKLARSALSAWLEPIASALDFIHKQGLVHRDVKPDNI